MIYKIIAVGFLTIILSSSLKSVKSDYSLLVGICGGLIIFYLILNGVTDLFENLSLFQGSSKISPEIITALVKVMGIGYVTEICSDIAEDSGNKFVANNVVLGGKIAICVMIFPVVKSLFGAIISLI